MMETKKTHGGPGRGQGRKSENTIQYNTSIPEELMDNFLKYYPKIDLNKALRKFMTEKIAYAEENMHDKSWSYALGIPQKIKTKKLR